MERSKARSGACRENNRFPDGAEHRFPGFANSLIRINRSMERSTHALPLCLASTLLLRQRERAEPYCYSRPHTGDNDRVWAGPASCAFNLEQRT